MHRNRTSRRRRSQGGFSLVESMVAMMILAIGTVALTAGVINSKGLQGHAVKINEASKISSAILESFRDVGYLALSEAVPSGDYSATALHTVYDDDNTPYEIIDAVTLYNVQSNLTNYSLTETIVVEHGFESVRVSVTIATAADPQTPIARMSTIITKNGLNFR